MHPLQQNTDILIDLLINIIDDGGEAYSTVLIDSIPYQQLVQRGWMYRENKGPYVLKFTVTPAGMRAVEPYRNPPPA